MAAPSLGWSLAIMTQRKLDANESHNGAFALTKLLRWDYETRSGTNTVFCSKMPNANPSLRNSGMSS